MAAGAGTVTIKILGDAKGALKAFAETEAGSESLGGKLKTLGTSMLAIGAVAGTAAVAVGAELFKIGADFDDAYDKIRVGTGATGAVLDGLKDDFRNVVSDVPTDFGKASDAITVLVQKLGLTGKPLDDVAEQFLELSRITKTDLAGNLQAGTDALNNWGVAAADQPGLLDELFRATQASGVSFADLTSQLSESGVQLQALGFNFDQATTVVAGLGKAGLSVSDVLPALSKAMAVGAKEGKSAQDVYQGLIRSIKDAPDDVAASAIAFDTLGAKAGPKFAALIREGKFSFDALGETIAEGSDTIIGAGKDTQDFAEKWELFKNRVLLALEPIATRVFTSIGELMDRLPSIAERVRATFEHWRPTLQRIADVVKTVADAFMAVLAPILEYITSHWDQLKIVLIALAAVIGTAVVAALAIMAAGLAVLVIGVTAAVAAVMLIIQALQWLWEKSEPVRKIIGDIAAGLTTFFVGAFHSAYTVVSDVVSIMQQLWDKSEGLRNFFATVFGAALGTVSGLFNDLRAAVDWLWSSLQRVFELAQRVADAVSKLPGINSITGGGAAQFFAPPTSGGSSNGPGISHAAAAGFQGWVNRATTFLTGEGGEREYVSITPESQMRSGGGTAGGGGGVQVHIDARGASAQGLQSAVDQLVAYARSNNAPVELKNWLAA